MRRQTLSIVALPLIALCSAAGAFAQPIEPVPAKSFTLEDAERLAERNSAKVLGAEQGIIIAQQRVQQAMFQFFPDIGLQASATRYDARYPFALAPEFRSVLLFPSDKFGIYSGRTYMTQTLYAGGRNMNLLRLSQTALKQAQTQYETVKMNTAYGVRQAFYQLLVNQELYAANSRRLEDARAFAGRALGGWERVEAEALVSQLRARDAEALHALELARLDFRKELNIELDTPFRVVGKLESRPIDIDLNKAVLWAMELRPELQSETYKAQMDDIAVALAQGRRIPTLVAAGDYEVTGQEFPLRQNNWDMTIGLKIPFSFDFWAEIREKRAEKRQGEIQRAELQDRVRLEVSQAYDQLQFWQKEWPEREREFRRLEDLAHAARADQRGLEPLRAQVALLEVEARYLNSLKEHILARARLERAVGRSLTP